MKQICSLFLSFVTYYLQQLKTALMLAASKNHVEIVQMLILRGHANPSLKDEVNEEN